jgi:Est1 DNA/RNA binding domain
MEVGARPVSIKAIWDNSYRLTGNALTFRAEIYLPGHALSVMATFSALVSERVLPTDIIWKTLVIALGALWRCRILRDPNAKRDVKKGHAVEARIFAHILSIMGTLYQIGGVQLADASSSPEPSINGTPLAAGEAQVDLAQCITAVFRRSLPTLRIGSKWLTVHVSYFSEAGSRLGSETGVDIAALLSEFWASYSSFSTLLGKIFPIDKLPKMTLPLEEDVDVSGFAPLKQVMFNPTSCTANGLEPGQSQVHPNEEQLMRISDLLQDAIRISESAVCLRLSPRPHHLRDLLQDSPVELAINSRREPEVNAAVDSAAAKHPSPKLDAAMTPLAFEQLAPDVEAPECGGSHDADIHSEVDDDNATVSTRTDDEIVNLAITANLLSDDDDEMEQVVYPKQTTAPMAV